MALSDICDEKRVELDAISRDETASEQVRARAEELKNRFVSLKNANDVSLEGCTQLLGAMQDFQHINFLYYAKASVETVKATDKVIAQEPNWKDMPPLDVAPELREQLAGRLIHAAFQHKEGERFSNSFEDTPPLENGQMILRLASASRGTAEYVVQYCLKHNVPFDIDFRDPFFQKTLIEESSKEQMKTLAAYNERKHANVTRQISIGARSPIEASINEAKDPNEEKKKIFDSVTSALTKKRMSGDVFYTLTLIPTPEDAALDNIPYKEYLKLFFELCDQPWESIHSANKVLIDHLEQAKTLHLIDEEAGTNLSMEIDNKRWANSMAYKNVPGSEVFASPKKDSVNGKLVAKGRFQYGSNDPVIEDITLVFKDGKVVDFDAARGRDTLAKIIESDDGKGEGSRFVGEIGIGTNPWLKKHVLNGLLVEKISGSAHIALGNSYRYTKYDGKHVMLDNGNRSDSDVHWDITTLLQGKDSKIVLDKGTDREYELMRAGRFADPALQVLNDGWGAEQLKDNAPPYWQHRLQEVASSRISRA